eukprot:6465907-Amphidinium_carterae.4
MEEQSVLPKLNSKLKIWSAMFPFVSIALLEVTAEGQRSNDCYLIHPKRMLQTADIEVADFLLSALGSEVMLGVVVAESISLNRESESCEFDYKPCLQQRSCLQNVFQMKRISDTGQVALEAVCGVQWLRHRDSRELAGPLTSDAVLFTEESDAAFVQDEEGSTWCSELLRFSDCYVEESGFIAVVDKETGQSHQSSSSVSCPGTGSVYLLNQSVTRRANSHSVRQSLSFTTLPCPSNCCSLVLSSVVSGATPPPAVVMDSVSQAGQSAGGSLQRAAKKAKKFETAANTTMNSMMDQALADINRHLTEDPRKILPCLMM